MVELYDVLLSALGGHFPSDAIKYDAQWSKRSLINIQKMMSEHEGEMALWIEVEGRKVLPPKLVEIGKVTDRDAILKYKTYDSRGKFRQYMTKRVDFVSIFCRQSRIKLFGDI